MSFFPRIATGAEKLMGGNGAYHARTKARHKTFILVQGTLQALETSARLSQETRTETEMLRSWDAELLSSESARNCSNGKRERTPPSRYGKIFFWGGPYSTVIKSDFWVIFHVAKSAFFRFFLAPQAPKIRFWGWFLSVCWGCFQPWVGAALRMFWDWFKLNLV